MLPLPPLAMQTHHRRTHNIQHRHHLFDLLKNQAAESALSFHKGTERLLNMPAARNPAVKYSESVIPKCPCYISREGSHTLWTESLSRRIPHAVPLCSTTMKMKDPHVNPHRTPNRHTSRISTTLHIWVTWASIFSHGSAPPINCGCGAPRVTESETYRTCTVLAAFRALNYGVLPPSSGPSRRYNTCASPSCLMNTTSVTCGMYTLPTTNTSSPDCSSKLSQPYKL